ncbi:MAG: UDP-4-amino-4,6-dideoxy-N-acetyl-beta-L-altrosamine transaminase [Eubacterium sp.]|nr:UDP-4-amino-4,6-dideoxy-N-acetyl-beta-L-altrosamine transaminase [Eubacterium sp.]
MEKLAINGGKPVRENKIFYGHQWINEDDIQAVVGVLKSDYLTCGPAVDRFEQNLAAYTGARYAVAVSNGTAALHCACFAAGISDGDEVIVSSMTFAASANCVLYCGGTPVFADIEPDTYNISPESIRQRITDKTKAVIAVDYTGQSVKHDEIRKICDEYNLVFIEDAAHAIGTAYKGKKTGSLADITTFSFHPVKTITGGEGGAVTTNSKEYYERLKLFRTHAITRDSDLMSQTDEGPWYYEQVDLGYNYRITDMQAALISSQMNRLEDLKARRKEIVSKYNNALEKIDGVIVQKEIDESDTCRHLYILRLDLTRLTCTRKEFFAAMSAENVQCQVHYVPVYWFLYYQNLGYKKGLCPNAEALYNSMMSLPLYPLMSDKDVEDVIAAVKKVIENYHK